MSDMRVWSDVDAYFERALLPADPHLRAALDDSEAAGMPGISVSPLQGAMLAILARSVGARRILEVGTLGGYSTICMAGSLPTDGRLISLEIDPKHAAVAERNIARAGLGAVVEIRVGRALDLLPEIRPEEGPFDLVFIDADKGGNADYFAWALKLTRPGSLIIVDNVVRGGGVASAQSRDASVLGVRRLVAMLEAEKRVQATAIQTVGQKGYDGFVLAVVL